MLGGGGERKYLEIAQHEVPCDFLEGVACCILVISDHQASSGVWMKLSMDEFVIRLLGGQGEMGCQTTWGGGGDGEPDCLGGRGRRGARLLGGEGETGSQTTWGGEGETGSQTAWGGGGDGEPDCLGGEGEMGSQTAWGVGGESFLSFPQPSL